jgi:hypothetical protein
MPSSYFSSLDWKNTPLRETLNDPRISSNGSFSGSDGRRCINWVILQRRLPRRSGCEGRAGKPLLMDPVFIMNSPGDAISGHISSYRSRMEKSLKPHGHKTYRETVLGKK